MGLACRGGLATYVLQATLVRITVIQTVKVKSIVTAMRIVSCRPSGPRFLEFSKKGGS